MTVTTAGRRPAVGSRRFGYAAAVLINAALLFAVNGWPGWGTLPFLTTDTPLVLDAINASMVVSLVANVVYLARDPLRLKALGDVITTAVALVALLGVWQVFPFDLDSRSIDWALVVRVMLGLAIAGSIIGIIARWAAFVRHLGDRRAPGR